MTAPTYIGDEWAAAGFRLAGFETLVPGDEDPVRVFERALAGASPLLLLDAGVASRIPPEQLDRARRIARPLLLVVGDPGGRQRPASLTARVRRRMGVAE